MMQRSERLESHGRWSAMCAPGAFVVSVGVVSWLVTVALIAATAWAVLAAGWVNGGDAAPSSATRLTKAPRDPRLSKAELRGSSHSVAL